MRGREGGGGRRGEGGLTSSSWSAGDTGIEAEDDVDMLLVVATLVVDAEWEVGGGDAE